MDGRHNPDALTTLRDGVLRRVRADIVSGRSPPGMLFSVPMLAGNIGVSTTPVREALLELSRAGLLVPLRNRGFQVTTMSLEALRHLFALRELLECFALTTPAGLRPSDPATLRQLADAVSEAVEREDVAMYIDADRAFHDALVSQAANPVLTRMIMELRDAMRLYGIETAAGRRRQVASVAEHEQLIELTVSGNAAAAAALMSRHILDWEPIFTEALRAQGKRATSPP